MATVVCWARPLPSSGASAAGAAAAAAAVAAASSAASSKFPDWRLTGTGGTSLSSSGASAHFDICDTQ